MKVTNIFPRKTHIAYFHSVKCYLLLFHLLSLILKECETLLSSLRLQEIAAVFDSAGAHSTDLIIGGENLESGVTLE